MTIESLVDTGYKIITIDNDNEALENLKNNSGIKLLFSDIVMLAGIFVLMGLCLSERKVLC